MRKEYIDILIADRDPQTAQKLFDTFRQVKDCHPEILRDSNNLLTATENAVSQKNYDLVFLDAAIGSSNGEYLSFSAKLNQLAPHTKFILMLNEFEQKLPVESAQTPNVRFLLKPILREYNVLRLVETCLKPMPAGSGLLLARNFSEYVLSNPTLKTILQKLVDAVVQNLGYEICAVILRRDDDEQSLYIAAAQGMSLEHQKEFDLKVGQGITGKVIATGNYRVVPNILSEPDYNYPGLAIKDSLCSMISLPLRHNQTILGALNVYTGAGYYHVFDADEINLLSTLANWTSFAIQNVEKYESKEKEQRRLIEEIILETQSSDSFEKMIEAVLQKSAALVGGNAGYVAFVDFEGMRFYPVFPYHRSIDNVQQLIIGTEYEGIAGDVVRHGEAELIDNVHNDPRYKIKTDQRIKSKVIVPLKIQKQVIGVLSIDSDREANFNEDDERILTALASHLPLIFQKQQFDQAFKNLGYLFRASPDLNEIYNTVVNCASEVIGTKAVALWEKDIDGSFVIRACLGWNKNEVQTYRIPADKGIISQVIESKEAVVIEDVSTNRKYVYPEMIAHTQFKWLLCVPMFFGNEVFGVIDVYSKRPHGFFEQEISYLKALASQAGVAIENAKLIDHFNIIGQTITSSKNINDILENIAQSALEVLCAEPVILFQYDQTIARLVPPPIYAGKLLEAKGYVETFEFTGYSFAELIVGAGESVYIEKNIDRHPFMLEVKMHDSGIMPKRRFNEREKNQSLAALILRAEKEIVGLMFLNYRTPQKFSPIEKKIMATFASHAAIAIRNSRLIEKLRNNEAFLEGIIQKSPDPIIVTEKNLDKNGHTTWTIQLANRAAHELHGYNFDSKELEGRNAKELFGEQANRLVDALREAEGEIANFETAFLHKEGYPISISLSTSILQKDPENKIIKTIGIAKDLTSKKELEKSKITIAKLRLTLADVGHEFRSPLHIIISQLGGLEYHLDKKYGEDQLVKKVARIVEEEAFRASRQMTNTLLSRVESFEALGANFVKGHIGDTIVFCAGRFIETAKKRGITIIVYDSVKKLPAIYFDKTQMEQVFTNLLDNAVKYSHSKQDIEIRGKQVGGEIRISIMDFGLGVPKNQYDRIFQGFTRSEILDSTRYIPGTGLGLMIAKEIVTRHHGTIRVKSFPVFRDPKKIENYEGFKTIFYVLLPQNF